MTTKHTPGPWRIGDAGHTVFDPPNGNPSPETICHLPGRGLDFAYLNSANARLVAAAAGGGVLNVLAPRKIIFDAIAKATGEQL